MERDNLPISLKDLTYGEMYQMARNFVVNQNIEAAAIVVHQMVTRWPERVLNTRKGTQKSKGGETNG